MHIQTDTYIDAVFLEFSWCMDTYQRSRTIFAPLPPALLQGKSQKIQEMFAGKEGFCNDEGAVVPLGRGSRPTDVVWQCLTMSGHFDGEFTIKRLRNHKAGC